MTVFLDITAALDGHLNTMTSVPPVAWENITYEPVVGTLYLRPTLLFGNTEIATIGDTTSTDQNIGIYQVDVFAEAGKGKNAAIVQADLVADRFKRGTEITYNGLTVRVKNVSMAQPVTVDGWYQVPVEIEYESYSGAR